MVKVPEQRDVVTAQANGWNFYHIGRGPSNAHAHVGEWYVACRRDDPASGKPHLSFPWSRWVYARDNALSVFDASYTAFKQYPTMIEPDFIFAQAAARSDAPDPLPGDGSDDSRHRDPTLDVRQGPSEAWPYPMDKNGAVRIAWQNDKDYTQLWKASDWVENHRTGPRISIGILDNGFSAAQAGEPPRSQLMDDKAGDALGTLLGEPQDELQAPGSTAASHGTGTLGILAGRKVTIQGTINGHSINFSGYLGGAPHEKIVSARIAPWVFSLTTANLAYGIDFASRLKGCDVISMSHGGAPSQVWADVVNAAYERGTAMFAAEGDFYSLFFLPLRPRGILVPSAPVYPASFRRVMGVTGVTSNEDTYAEGDLGNLVAYPWTIGDWVSRGSFGPKGCWRTPFASNEAPDPATVKDVGRLRAYPIAAYSPNIPWLVAPTKSDPSINKIDLDGSGTSAATPQVAAAAALWLDQHRSDFSEKEWSSYRKVEAVYCALLASAKRDSKHTWPDYYQGAGTLKALDALHMNYADVQKFAHENPDLLKFGKAPTDFYDADRSFLGLFGLADNIPINERADLDQHPEPNASRETLLTRLFYNTLLLKEWHAGHLPKGQELAWNFHRSAELEAEAQQLARKALQGGKHP